MTKADQIASKFLNTRGKEDLDDLSKEECKELRVLLEDCVFNLNIADREYVEARAKVHREAYDKLLQELLPPSLMARCAILPLTHHFNEEQFEQVFTTVSNFMEQALELRQKMNALHYTLAMVDSMLKKDKELQELQEAVQ